MMTTWRKRYRPRFRQEIEETHGRKQVRKKERTNDQVAHMDDNADETKRAPTFEPCSVMCNNECVFTV